MRKAILALAILSVVALVITPAWAKHHKAVVDPPTLGADCGSGATVAGTDTAGVITLGTQSPYVGECTLIFTTADANRACFGTHENQFAPTAFGEALGVWHVDDVTERFGANQATMNDGDMISYGCNP